MSATSALWEASYHRVACVECQRRKQRCDREWPCENCSRRKVPDRCRYNEPDLPSKADPKDSANYLTLSEANTLRGKRKLRPSAEQDVLRTSQGASVDDVTDEETTLKAIGYRPSSLMNLSKLVKRANDTCSHGKPGSPVGDVTATRADEMRIIEMLPLQHHLEILLSTFTETVNYSYYIIDPTKLMETYSTWQWGLRRPSPALDPTFVGLMLRICTCAVLCLNADVKERIEADLNMPIQNLVDRCNQAAIELSGKIPVGQGGLLQVQQLLLTSYWHNSRGEFFDCWDALGAAVREARAIGLNKESSADGLSEFDRDMRRRIWCILDVWDWQISTLFSRPQLINRHDCDIVSPNVHLEEAAPSPIYHIKLQFEVIRIIHEKFGNINRPMNAARVREFQNVVNKWTESFPPTLRIADPDIDIDERYPWMTTQRQYLHVMAYTMILVPLKSYLCRTFGDKESFEDQETRASAVDYCLKLRDAHILLFHSTYPFCTKYHIAHSSLVDLGIILCFAITHDQHSNLPERNQVLGIIGDVLEMLRHIQNAADTSLLSHKLITKLARRLPISQNEKDIIRYRTIAVKFDQNPPLDTKPTQNSRWPIVIPVSKASAMEDPSETFVTKIESIDGGPPTPVSIDGEATTFGPHLPLEDPDGDASNLDATANEHESLMLLDPSDSHQTTNPIPMSSQPVLEVFLERFLDSYGPEMPSAWQPLHWIHAGQPYQIWRVGAASRLSSTLLCDSFTAVSVAQFGRSISDWRFISAADRIYLTVLASLQAAVYHPERSASDDVLWAAVLCAVYEGVSRTTGNGFLTHVLGILKLLEFRGSRQHALGIGHGLFVELRCYFVFAAITTRLPTFLAHPEWKHVPWSAGSTPKDLLQHLLDHVVEIPALLAYADRLKNCSPAKSPVETSRLQEELWTFADRIEQALYQWKREWADSYPGGQPTELSARIQDNLSTFRRQDRITGEIICSTTLVYPDPVLAQAMCYYYAALILVFSADARPRETELSDMYSLACSICRIMGFFARTVPSGLASRVAFPFRLAYDCLPEGSIERDYVEEAFRWIAKRRFSQEWECTLDGLSVRD